MAAYDRCSECREIIGNCQEISINREPIPRLRLHPECVEAYARRTEGKGKRQAAMAEFIREIRDHYYSEGVER